MGDPTSRATRDRGTSSGTAGRELRETLVPQRGRRNRLMGERLRRQVEAEVAAANERIDAHLREQDAAFTERTLARPDPVVAEPAVGFAELAADGFVGGPLPEVRDRLRPLGAPAPPTTRSSLLRPPRFFPSGPRSGTPPGARRLRTSTGPRAQRVEAHQSGSREAPAAETVAAGESRIPLPGTFADLPRATVTGISLEDALRRLRSADVGDLRSIGLRLPGLPSNLPMTSPRVTSAVVYVGPGVAGFFTTGGKLLQTPVGHSEHVLAATEPPGLWYGGGEDVVAGPQYRKRFFAVDFSTRPYRVREGSVPGINVEGRYQELEDMRHWSLFGGAKMFVISPTYWQRKSLRQALLDAPERLFLAVERSVSAGYVSDALGTAVSSATVWDAARGILAELIKKFIPVPLPGEVEALEPRGIAVAMATWGADRVNTSADVDVAARLLAPEIASEIVGKVTSKAIKGVSRAGRAVRKPGAGTQQRSRGEAPESASNLPGTSSTTPDTRAVSQTAREAARSNGERGRARTSTAAVPVNRGVRATSPSSPSSTVGDERLALGTPARASTSTGSTRSVRVGRPLSKEAVAALAAKHPALPQYLMRRPKISLDEQTTSQLAGIFRSTRRAGGTYQRVRAASGELAVIEKVSRVRDTRSIRVLPAGRRSGDRTPDLRVTRSTGEVYHVEITTPTLSRRGQRGPLRGDAAGPLARRRPPSDKTRVATSTEIQAAFKRKIDREQLSTQRPGVIVVNLQRRPAAGPVLTRDQIRDLEAEIVNKPHIRALLVVVPEKSGRQVLRVGSRSSGLEIADGLLQPE